MKALIIIGIILLCFLLLLLIRIRVLLRFGEVDSATLRIGFIKKTLYPTKKKEKVPAQETSTETQPTAKPKKKRRIPKPTLDDIFDLAETALETLSTTLSRLCHRLCIDPLDVSIVIAGGDPADVGRTYGIANAAMWTMMPRLEELFRIPDPHIRLDMDFERERTTAEGTVGISLRVSDILAVAFTLALPLLGWLVRFKRAHANDPVPPKSDTQGDTTEQTTEKLSA